MNAGLKLYMDLSALLPTIREATVAPEVRPGTPLRLGANDTAKPAIIAALTQQTKTPVLVLVSRSSDAQDLLEELSAWLGPEDSRRLRLYPQRDILPYERASEDPWDIKLRLETIVALQRNEPLIAIVTVEGAAQRTLAPEAIKDVVTEVATGDSISPEDLLRRLQNSGYEVVPLVDTPGQAARRGGIVDVFAPQADEPVRVEFFGSKIESIRGFDTGTQRSRERLDRLRLGVAHEFTPDLELAGKLLGELDFSGCNDEIESALREELAQLADGLMPAPPAFLPGLFSPFSLLDHLPKSTTVILDEPVDLGRTLDEYVAETSSMRVERESRGLLPAGLPPAQANWPELQAQLAKAGVLELKRFGTEESGAICPAFNQAPAFGGRLRALAGEINDAAKRGDAIVLLSQQASRLAALLGDEGVPVRAADTALEVPEPNVIQILKGSLPHGWVLQGEPNITFLTDAEIFGFVKQRRAQRQAGPDRSNLIAELTPGDFVVHLEHGIGRFTGLTVRSVEGVEKEFLELAYAEGDKLYVPVDQSDRVARYVGPGDARPSLTRLGSGEWSRTRERVRRAVADVARELLDLYAAREVVEGHAFSPDTPWQQELEASFPFVETPDQLSAINAVKADMESTRPMDRLICGDVGYGKTEVAVRAAFKAVMDGFQVAMLVPTTVLAQQHFNTFKERLASLPARIQVLSRFLNDREQREVVAATADGSVDILIGTHRILQKDVSFKQLALVIIDEEQRFGVAHKERLKQMRQQVDVLTLSATPIPRTLHMSLAGIRDLSNMTTPPEHRVPIRTYVTESHDQIVREAILRELERGGQVFFVHNRVHNIEMIAAKVRDLVPEAVVGIGHGQMHEDQLEKAMLDFGSGEIDVLVCTTIIESGLDIQNANTIIINQADRLGLSQLYQLRGRVGRGAARAYAYLIYERSHSLSETAQRRLQAIFEATELGAGFQIALRDLEIRGAGNLLGSEQSGHMAAVGFELYIKLLGEAVERLKSLQRGETPAEPNSSRPAVTLDLPITAYLSDSYISDLNLRLAIYQRLAQFETLEEVAGIEQELTDRFGSLPSAARNLIWVVRLRLLAVAAGVGAIQAENDQFVIRLLPGRELDRGAVGGRLPAGASATAHQVRLNRDALGESWREGVVRALDAILPASDAVAAG